jgi:hypothetical protein
LHLEAELVQIDLQHTSTLTTPGVRHQA